MLIDIVPRDSCCPSKFPIFIFFHRFNLTKFAQIRVHKSALCMSCNVADTCRPESGPQWAVSPSSLKRHMIDESVLYSPNNNKKTTTTTVQISYPFEKLPSNRDYTTFMPLHPLEKLCLFFIIVKQFGYDDGGLHNGWRRRLLLLLNLAAVMFGDF